MKFVLPLQVVGRLMKQTMREILKFTNSIPPINSRQWFECVWKLLPGPQRKISPFGGGRERNI